MMPVFGSPAAIQHKRKRPTLAVGTVVASEAAASIAAQIRALPHVSESVIHLAFAGVEVDFRTDRHRTLGLGQVEYADKRRLETLAGGGIGDRPNRLPMVTGWPVVTKAEAVKVASLPGWWKLFIRVPLSSSRAGSHQGAGAVHRQAGVTCPAWCCRPAWFRLLENGQPDRLQSA